MKGLIISSLLVAANGLSFEADKNRPVSKVITLLKDMQKQLEHEAEADQEIYDKMACWCTTNDKEKTAAIEAAEQRIAQLTASIEEGTAKSAQLSTEIKNLEKEVAANQQALAKATALRQKQLAEFNGEEKDLLQSIGALKSAITVLSKHHPNSLLQADSESMINLAVMLKRTMKKYQNQLEDVVTPAQQATLKAFVQNVPAYAPQSGEIFGILRNMKDTFESNLSASQKEELENQKAYEDLKAAKEAEITAGQAQIDTKTDELAATDEKVANDKQDVEDTRNSLSADEKFLMDLKEKCKQTDQEWEQRQKTRSEEIQAVSKALEFLSSDDAHDLFTKTFNFVQTMSTQESNRRQQAASLLTTVAKKLAAPQLATIAQSVRLDAFTKVKKAIDDMVTELLKQKEDEIKHRDFCINNFNENDKQNAHETRNKEDQLAKIDELTANIESLAAAIKDLQDQIHESEVQLKRAGEDREKQNAEFQETVQDQRATMKLLGQALNVLKGFYAKNAKGVALNQEPVGPPPPAGFKSYGNNAGGNSVVAMITQIINDAKAMEAEAIHDEEDAQAAYESFVQETNNSITENNRNIVNKSQTKATAEGDKAQTEEQLSNTEIELEQLSNEKADLHKACDFVVKNFDIRQAARDEEVEALRQAKAILSGADFK